MNEKGGAQRVPVEENREGTEIHGMKKRNALSKPRKAVAVQIAEPLDTERFPAPSSWERAAPLRFDADWQGKNAGAQPETEVRCVWTTDTRFLRFRPKNRP